MSTGVLLEITEPATHRGLHDRISPAVVMLRASIAAASSAWPAWSWLTPVSEALARQAETSRQPAKSIILLWLAGGPSQLETFDPHPNTKIAAGTGAIGTAVKGVQLASGFGRLAEGMDKVALIRSMVSKEGDHERGTYLMKTGYRPDPTVEHPSIGAICCHELPVGQTDIPRHISILTGQWPSRGGFLGGEFDAFQIGDPNGRLPDVTATGPGRRDDDACAPTWRSSTAASAGAAGSSRPCTARRRRWRGR